MFAGGRRRSSNNVRAMQLFHELKQQFPTIPDHVVSACIANNDQRPADHVLREVLEAAATLQNELMGRNPSDRSLSPTPDVPERKDININTTPNNKISRPNVSKSVNHAQNNLGITHKLKLNSNNDKLSENLCFRKENLCFHENSTNENLSFRKDNEKVISHKNKSIKKIGFHKHEKLGIHKETINNVCNALIKSKQAQTSNSQTPTRPERRLRSDMNQSESDLNRNIIKKPESGDPKRPVLKRPDTLDIKSDHDATDSACKIQQSEKCKNVFKLLNSSKPPKSPGTPKRQLVKQSPRSNLVKSSDLSDTSELVKKTETTETPTQTTNTLSDPPPNLNLSLNVNYSMGVIPPKHTTALHVVPQQPWIPDLSSPRSFTSVNLTLRPPSSEPQPPIDITSRNSSLTYSTSTFDSQKGLQSKLQITVSPTGGCVSSIRTRPRSYHSGEAMEPPQAQRTGSLQDLSMSPILLKQQARIEKLRIELKSENMRLVALQSEVSRLESSRSDVASDRTDAELEKQLQKEIRHLRGQCERLTVEVDRQTENGVPLGETNEEFYRNIYTGQRGPLNFGLFDQRISSGRSRVQPPAPNLPQSENYGPKWSCSLCTFQNHPLLDKCEQCEMARIVHGMPKPADKRNPSLSYLLNLQASLNANNAVTAANNLLQHVTNNANPEYLRRYSEEVGRNQVSDGSKIADTPANFNNTH